MTQEELFKALRGERRTQVDLSLGQVPISPTIQSGGRYTVVVPGFSKQNSATRLSAVLAQVPQVAGQFKNIQEQAGIREANELTPDEVIRRVESGDTEAQGILASYGKEKTFQEQLYARYFSSSLQPAFTRVEAELRNLTPRQLSEIGDVRSYAQQKIVEAIDPEVFETIKNPNNRFMAVRHNLAMEAIVPKIVESVTGNAEAKKGAYARDEAINNAAGEMADVLIPQSRPSDAMVGESIKGLISTAFGSAAIDPTTAKEIDDGTMARVKGDPKRGSSGMLYRGLEADIPTVAVHKSSGLKAKDYIKVTSDLFPEGKIFQVAGTGPAPGRLDFYSSDKEQYNNFASQKLQSVVKVDKDGNEVGLKDTQNISTVVDKDGKEVGLKAPSNISTVKVDKDGKEVGLKAPPNISTVVDSLVSNLATQGIAQETILKTVASGLGQRFDAYIAYGDFESANELLEYVENGDIKVEGRSFIKTFQGRALASEALKKIEAAEDAAERKENNILGDESKRNENEFSAAIAEIAISIADDASPEQIEEAKTKLEEIEAQVLTSQKDNNLDAASSARLRNTLDNTTNDIETGSIRQNNLVAQRISAWEAQNARTVESLQKTFGDMTDSALGVVSEVLGSDYVDQHYQDQNYSGNPSYSLQLQHFVSGIAAAAREITSKQLLNTLDPSDPLFRDKYEQALADNYKKLLEGEKEKAPEPPVAQTTTADARVRDELRKQNLVPTSENIRMAQDQLLAETPDTPSGKLFNRQYQLKDNFGKLSSISLLRGFNDFVDNPLLRDRTELSTSQVASIAVTASKNAITPSFSSDINKALETAASPIKKAQIRQNWSLNYVKNTGLPVEFLEGDMMTNHFAGFKSYPMVGRVRNMVKIDFDNGDRYFKRYKRAVMSAEALAAYSNGDETLLDRVFNAGVAKGQLTEAQKADFIESQLELGRKIGILEQLTETNEQQQ